MRPSIALQTYREQIKIIEQAYHAGNVLGSALRGEDTGDSELHEGAEFKRDVRVGC